jgi:hypothetical protein
MLKVKIGLRKFKNTVKLRVFINDHSNETCGNQKTKCLRKDLSTILCNILSTHKFLEGSKRHEK